MKITVDRETDPRDFRERVEATVVQTDYSDGVTYYISRVLSVYAYHPRLPDAGRALPVSGGLIAYTDADITSKEEA